MPFLYEFSIDNEKVEGQIGFSTSRKWEEALDEATLVIPFTYQNETPYKMFSMLNIEISKIDNYVDRNTIDTRTYEFIIYSDNVESLGSYGYYRHQVNAIEYTAKLDYYMINNLSKSRSVLKDTQAPFKNEIISSFSIGTQWQQKVTLEHIDVKENFYANKDLVFTKVYQAYVNSLDAATAPFGFKRVNAVIRTNATLVSGSSSNPHTLSSGPATWAFPIGEWEIEYGFIADGTEDYGYDVGFNAIYTFYVEAINQYELSMYDVINEIRDSVSKYGGIEDTKYYDSTRIFDISSADEIYLKSIQAPQIYLSQATARQMLIYAMSFMNALPRLEYGETLDNLTLEKYNISNGTFTQQDVIAYGGKQNTNQIGTRNYQPIAQALANNLDDTSVHSPSRSGYQQVRSLDIQLTADNFVIKLPDKAPLYMPKKLVVIVPEITVAAQGGMETILTLTDFELDLTPRWINTEEWKLKEITTNFPDITSRDIWEEELGLRTYKVENLTWKTGDTHINISTVFRTLFGDNLIRNVVRMAVYEYIMLHPPIPIIASGAFDDVLIINLDIPSKSEYKDWRFRVEYITDERLVIKQEKEDLSQVSFYSEMRQNQEESLVNIVRQSRKGYGDLQRTGNVTHSFPKKHTTLATFDSVTAPNGFYEIGMKDSNHYTITQIDTQWYNDYAIATYHITKYHNRIQQATFVNQKYRPFDNYAKTVLTRHEHYGDYLIALPPDDTTSGVQEQDTKIYSNDNTVRMITKILLGNDFGLPSKPSASVALVRTDGMLTSYPESGSGTDVKFIVSPLTSRGIKGGFAFTLGFKNNQIAGDGLVSETVGSTTTYYNEAVRYTDSKGRFTRFGFAIMRDWDFDSGDDLTFPLITDYIVAVNTNFSSKAYFWCGYYYTNQAFANPLVWNKDPMTNAELTYQLNVVSYYIGLYIFGLKFFTDNYIVREHNILNGAKLYVYNDSTRYEMFDDIFVKSGYVGSYSLRDNEIYGDGNVEYDHIENTVLFVGISMTSITSWAIGITNDNGDIELLVACNEGLNGVKFVNRHIRPNVLEIGNRTPINEYMIADLALEFDSDLVYVRGREVPLTVDSVLELTSVITHERGREVPLTIDSELEFDTDIIYRSSKNIGDNLDDELTLKTKLKYFIGDSVPLEIDFGLVLTNDLVYRASKNIGDNLDIGLILTNTLTHERGREVALTSDFGVVLTNTLTHERGREVASTSDFGLTIDGDFVYVRGDEILLTSDFGLTFTNDLVYRVSKDIGDNLDVGMTFSPTITYFVGSSVPIILDTILTFDTDIQFYKDIELTIDSALALTTDIVFVKDVEFTVDLGMAFSVDIQYTHDRELTTDLGLELTSVIDYVRGTELLSDLDFILNTAFDIQFGRTREVEDTLDLSATVSFNIQYTKYEPQYSSPTIDVADASLGTDLGGDYYHIVYKVRNNDSDTGRVGHGVSTTPPTFVTTNMVELTSGQWSDYIETQAYYTSGTPKLYAQTRDVTGEDDQEPSEIVMWDSWT